MGLKRFSILSSLLIIVAFLALWPGIAANGQRAPALDASERFISWSIEGDQEGAALGRSVDAAGDVNGDGFDDLIVGAPGYHSTATEAGRAYLFLGSAAGLATGPAWHASGTVGGFGWSVVAAGDVNGDGFDDVLVADRPDLGPSPWYLFYGTSSGLEGSPGWSSAGKAASAGDFNGDGYDDILLGWDYYSNGQSLEGVAWVFLGSPTGPSTDPDWTVEGGFVDASFGRYVGSAGDVNGDGYDDAMVGRWHNVTGASYLFLGSATGLATTPAWMRDGYVHDVGTAGDTNGDGYDDVVVLTTTDYPMPRPVTAVFLGSPLGLGTSPAWVRTDGGSCIGPQAGAAGDVNADGYADLVIAQIAAHDTCRTYVFYGSSLGLSTSAQWIGPFGYAAMAGDVNGDGHSDLAVGDPFYTGDLTNEGQASAYHGSYHGLSGTIAGYHLATPPAIDGDLSDWGLQTPLVLDSNTAQTVLLRGAQTTPPLPADSSANLRAGWDADYVYLAVHVVDDFIVSDSSDVWRDDEIELAFDGNHDGWTYSVLDHQYTVNADGRLTDRAVPAPPGVTAAVEWVSGGWDVEVRIARSALSATPWQAGRTFGFSLGLHDDDDFDDWDSYLIWAGDDTASGAQGFATLRLITGDAPPPATSTTTATATGTSTKTSTPTVTRTPTGTPTPTVTRTPTNTPTPTQTNTSTATATRTSTPTATSTSTATRLPTRYLPLILHRSP